MIKGHKGVLRMIRRTGSNAERNIPMAGMSWFAINLIRVEGKPL